MWKTVRVSLLLALLVFVAFTTWYERHRARDWRDTQRIGVFPVAGDDSPVTLGYLRQLESGEFADLEAFMSGQAGDYGLASREPVKIELYPTVLRAPPAPPAPGQPLSAILWSLELRSYAARFGSAPGRAPSVRMFVVYHDPARTPRLAHSAGLEKGLIGVAHVFAAARMRGSNSVVIAHEYLHTLGATDKYDPATDAPLYPVGYAEPAADPRYPQRFAELMAGRRPLTPSTQEMPESLEQCMIGEASAREIGWLSR